jgi:hypothetical protein
VPFPVEQPKLLSKEQSAPFFKELDVSVELQQELLFKENTDQKEKVKYLAKKKTNPFREDPLWIPDISVSSILCSTLLYYNYNSISCSFLPF